MASCGAIALTGCSDGTGGSTPATATDPPSESPVADDMETSPPGDLDLREANVVGATVEHLDGRRYRFDVTLHHDDAGEDGYADWWQVETLDGTQLGRRDLLHPHDEQPFTRSGTIGVPGDVACVVVRGHDRTHGYGGQAVLVNPTTGARLGVRQGTNRQSVADEICP